MKELVAQPLEQSLESIAAPSITEQTQSSISTPILPPISPAARIRHNLPAPTCSRFVGREFEIAKLLELLSPRHGAQLISVDGIGGVGKTSLVVQVAYQCLQASCSPDEAFQGVPTFDVIVFTSAKQDVLAPFGLVQRIGRSQRTLQAILRQIAHTVGDIDIVGKSLEEQVELIQDVLATYRTLIIVDNLETIESPETVLSFLYCDLPPSVKAIITTRQQGVFTPIRLSSLPEADALHLIQQEANTKQIVLRPEDQYQLYQRTSGIPVAIHYAIGQMASCYSVHHVLSLLSQADNDVTRFCFETSIAPLRGHPAHQILMVLSFFPAPVQRDTLIQVALSTTSFDIDYYQQEQIAEDAFARLQELSLVVQQNDRYSILSLTREYAIAELKKYPDLEKQAREQWVRWCLALAETYGKQADWNWQYSNDVLEAEWLNIQSVIEWCMSKGRYDDLYQLWKHFKIHIHLQGDRGNRHQYWGEHLEWIDWLIQGAWKQGVQTAVELILSRGWLLTAMGQPERLEEADRLYEEALGLRRHLSPEIQLILVLNIAALRVRQNQVEAAQPWLDQAIDLVKHESIAESEHNMQLSRIHYYQGIVNFHAQAYEQAKMHFEYAADYAHLVHWQRVIHRSRNWLADIAIHQEDPETAKRLLEDGLAIAQTSRDMYQLAFYQRSLAYLAQAQGDRALAQQWAQQALHNFQTLELMAETQELASFLQTLNA
jgi:LuxR family glucitol operon transcriptional activator